MRAVTRLSDNLLNFVLVSAGLQEGYGFPEELKKIDQADRSLLVNSSLAKRLPRIQQRSSEILRYFIGSSTASSFNETIIFLRDVAASIEKHKPIGYMMRVSDVYSDFSPGLVDHFLSCARADDIRKLIQVVISVKNGFFSQYWDRIRSKLEKRVRQAVEYLLELHARETVAETLGRDLDGTVEIRMVDCLRYGPAYSAFPTAIYLPPCGDIRLENLGLGRALLPAFAHELTHLILRNSEIFKSEAVAAAIRRIREKIFPSFLDVGFEVILVEHPLISIVEEEIYNRYGIPFPHYWGKVNKEDLSSIWHEEMRKCFARIWDELRNADNEKFARLIGCILEETQERLFSTIRNL